MNQQMLLNMLIQNNPNFRSNPLANNAMQMYQNGNTNELKKIAENLARQKGVNIEDIRKQIGM